MSHSLILGGTKGLGLELARTSAVSGTQPIICGRTAPASSDSEFIQLDLTNDASIKQFSADYDGIDYLVWCAGIFLREPLVKCRGYEIDQMIDTHIRGPMKFIKKFHANKRSPYHLVVIASTSSWRIRDNETLYCMLKAGKAAFARNFAQELHRDLPGSKTTLINPGGLKTPNFWAESGQDISKFMDPAKVAKIIWEICFQQISPFLEVQIIRNDDGSPRIEYGPRLAEMPKLD